jgi:hypothetical protein
LLYFEAPCGNWKHENPFDFVYFLKKRIKMTSPGACYRCKSTEHWFKNCPYPKEWSREECENAEKAKAPPPNSEPRRRQRADAIKDLEDEIEATIKKLKDLVLQLAEAKAMNRAKGLMMQTLRLAEEAERAEQAEQ